MVSYCCVFLKVLLYNLYFSQVPEGGPCEGPADQRDLALRV